MPLKTKYGQYVTREIIVESKYPQISAPMARYNGCRGGGNVLNVEWSCITKPFVMDAEPEVDNERDQFLLFVPSNIEDPKDFQAEIELTLGEKGKKQLITEPTYVYIPKGLKHGFVNFKKIKKPIAFVNYFLSPEFSTGWDEPDYLKYLAKLGEKRPSMIVGPTPGGAIAPDATVNRVPAPDARATVAPARMELANGHAYVEMLMGNKGMLYLLWSSWFGWPAKVSPVYDSISSRSYMYLEPVHAHRNSHQIAMYLGGNPLDISDFDAVIEIFMGKEREMHVIDTCAVDHYVPGIVHLGDEVRLVNKPFIHLMWLIGPEMNNYYKAAATDKVILSDPSKGEVLKTERAPDYVPPTKMEDYVWPHPKKK